MQNAAAASNPTASNLAVLMDMGFSEEQAKEVKPYRNEIVYFEKCLLFILGSETCRKS